MTTQIAHFRDSVTPDAIGTSTCDGVIAYATGGYAWSAAEVNRFIAAGKRVHKYDVNGSGWDIADVLDVERGAASLSDVPGWVDKRWAAHSTAGVYASRSNIADVVHALAGRPCYLIVADWTGKAHVPVLDFELPPRVVVAGVQYATRTTGPLWDDLAIYSRGWLEGARL